MSLRNSFKNFRRGLDLRKKSPSAGPPSKRIFIEQPAEEIDDEQYEEALTDLKTMYDDHESKKAAINRREVNSLMVFTRARRNQWIREEHPLVIEVISKFPYLKESVSVRYSIVN